MKIATLGWGSLLWDANPAFDQQHEDWLFDGPLLNLEFSRISASRDDALTLVIDDTNGSPCTTAYAISKRRDPNDAICDLRSREGTILKRIGFWFADETRACDLPVPVTVQVWAGLHHIDVVIWTGLGSNFADKVGELFTVEAAVQHIQGLEAAGKAKAAEYVWRAPAFVQTPLREALDAQPWFAPDNPK